MYLDLLPPLGPLLFLPLLPVVLLAVLCVVIALAVATLLGGALLLTVAPAAAAERHWAAVAVPGERQSAAPAVGAQRQSAPPAVRAERHWAPPVAGAPSRVFRLGADPFRRGQHRGVDYAARGSVSAACAGRVVFAGRVAGEGTVSVRCGRWRVSYAPLAQLRVREGERIGAGARLGRSARGLHFGVRREGRRFGYVDPLRFFGARRAPPPVAGPAPRRAPPPRAPSAPLAAHPRAAAPSLAPWPVWVGLALGLTGLLGASRLRPSSRRQEGAPCRVSSTSSSSPTIPSSP
jgi:Peptidase family M23